MKLIHKPYAKFKGWLRENGIIYDDIARLIGTSTPTVCAKINGQSDFLLSETKIIKKKYHLTDDIFYTDDVA